MGTLRATRNVWSAMKVRRPLVVGFLAIGISLTLACGGGSGPGSPPPKAPSITSQPGDLSTPLGQTATFKVVATGSTPLNYQWSENGSAIMGATSSSYTTPPVAAADSGAAFNVTVTNSAASATSRTATLTVGPRSPQAGDLRFQLVDSAFTANGYGHTGLPIHYGFSSGGLFFTNYYGTPFSVGADCYGAGHLYDCMYFLWAFPLPVGVPDLTTNYESDYVENFDRDLGGIVAPNTVITGLNLEPTHDAFGISWIQSPQSAGFDYAQQTVALSDLQVFAAQQGALGRVITAVSFGASGDVLVMSYGWQSDPTTIYDAQVATATFDTVGTEAANLAAQGYIITALGAGNDSPQGVPQNGLLLIGTRVQGDNMPRPLKVVPDSSQKAELWDQGYAVVGHIRNPNGFVVSWIGEK